MSVLGTLAIAGGIAAINGIANYLGSSASTGMSVDAQKELFDYQWQKAASPHAQVQNLTAEGINPTAVFGKSPNVVGGAMPSVSVPPIHFSTGIENLRDLTGALSDLASAKKTGVDTRKAEKEVEGQQLSNDALALQNRITQEYGMKRAGLDLANAYQGVLLAEKENDLKAKEKARKDWEIAKEKALSEATEANRDILRKELANKDKEIELRNKESEARAEASRASAQSSYTQADVNREQRRISAALADIEEQGQDSKLRALLAQYRKDGLISESDAKEAEMKLEQLTDLHAARNNTKLARAIDDVAEWIKDKVSIFGTLK